MGTRILNHYERALMSPACQKIFLKLYSNPSMNLYTLEQALATVLGGQEIFGRPGENVRVDDLVEAYSRIELMRRNLVDSPYDYLSRRHSDELGN